MRSLKRYAKHIRFLTPWWQLCWCPTAQDRSRCTQSLQWGVYAVCVFCVLYFGGRTSGSLVSSFSHTNPMIFELLFLSANGAVDSAFRCRCYPLSPCHYFANRCTAATAFVCPSPLSPCLATSHHFSDRCAPTGYSLESSLGHAMPLTVSVL